MSLNLTDAEARLCILVLQSAKDLQIDTQKLADLGGYANKATANAQWYRLRKKMETAQGDAAAVAGEGGNAGKTAAPGSSKKRGVGAAASGTPTPAKKTKGKGKVKKEQEEEEEEEVEQGEEAGDGQAEEGDAVTSGTPAKKTKGKGKGKVKKEEEEQEEAVDEQAEHDDAVTSGTFAKKTKTKAKGRGKVKQEEEAVDQEPEDGDVFL